MYFPFKTVLDTCTLFECVINVITTSKTLTSSCNWYLVITVAVFLNML